MTVYFIRAADGTGPVKIGHTNNPHKRLGTIQNMSPVRLCVLKTIRGGQGLEGVLHQKFAHLRLWGEWFDPQPELLAFIKAYSETKVDESTLRPDPKHCKGCGRLIYGKDSCGKCDPDRSQCQAITRTGKRCLNKATFDEGFCAYHWYLNRDTRVLTGAAPAVSGA